MRSTGCGRGSSANFSHCDWHGTAAPSRAVPSKAAAPTDWNDVLPRGSSALLVRGENDARRLGCIPVTFLSFLVMLEQSDMLTLRHLEESLWRRETRFDSRYMEEILAPEFIEFGRSGRKYSRADSLGLEAYDIAAKIAPARFLSPRGDLGGGFGHVPKRGQPRGA